MKKKILLLVTLLLIVTGCGKVPKLSNGEEAMVSFDNKKLNISVDTLYNELKDKYAINILIDLIDSKILLDKYPDKDLDAKNYYKEQFESIKESYKDDNGKYDEDALLSDLAQYYGITTIKGYEEMVTLSYYRTLATEDYAKDQITDKEIKNYYKDEVDGDISAKHILISSKVTEEMSKKEIEKAEAAALKKAKEVIKKLDDGEKFDDLAKEYSDDKSNSDKGGDLGYFNKGDMVEEFEKAAYALKTKEYTKTPVKTSYGYHIILKTDQKEKKELKEIKKDIIDKLSKKLLEKDKTMPVNALADLRKEYGFKIEDSDLNKKFSSFISNRLLSLSQQ